MLNKSGLATNMLETFQWFMFLLASAVALPIVIGSVYQLDFTEVSALMQRTFFTVGIASFLQALFGHKMPIMEVPAGIWISIFTVMAATGVQTGGTYKGTLQTLEMTMILAGGFLFLFGAFKVSEKILPIFTPLVTGTFFLLLTVQLSETLLQGMLGLDENTDTIQIGQAVISFLTFVIVLGLSTFARGRLGSYAVFIGILIGWLLFRMTIGGEDKQASFSLFSAPDVFAFGPPIFEWSLLPVAFIIAVVSISNIVASMKAVRQTLDAQSDIKGRQVNKGTIFSGINHLIAGTLGTIANVPSATSSGFISLTGQTRKLPFVYATILLMLFAFFPPVTKVISSIPPPVANAALMASFVELVAIGVNNMSANAPLDTRKKTIIGIAYLFGMGVMFLPAEAFSNMPPIVQNLLSNGLLVGMALVIILEQSWRPKEERERK